MRFNIGNILNSFFKNPTNSILLVAAFGAGFYVAKQMIVPQSKAMAAIPQYQNESEVQYPRQFQGMNDWQYTDSTGYTTPDVMGIEGDGSGVDIPRISNSFYDDVVYDDSDYDDADDVVDDSYY